MKSRLSLSLRVKFDFVPAKGKVTTKIAPKDEKRWAEFNKPRAIAL